MGNTLKVDLMVTVVRCRGPCYLWLLEAVFMVSVPFVIPSSRSLVFCITAEPVWCMFC